VSSAIDEKQIRELPLMWRNFLMLAMLAPGAGRATFTYRFGDSSVPPRVRMQMDGGARSTCRTGSPMRAGPWNRARH
jgi:hypothetical protein